MAFVRNPIVYVPDLTNGRPVVDGKVYLLAKGTIAPTHSSSINPSTLLSISYINEAGNTVPQPQPLYTSKGGCLYGSYPDEARQFSLAEQEYVFAVYNRIGRLEYAGHYTNSALSADYVGETAPLTPFQGMRWYNPTIPTTFIYYVDANSAQWVEEVRQGGDSPFVTPEMFGAKGDGVTDDTDAVQNAIEFCSSNSVKTLTITKYYKVDSSSLPDVFNNAGVPVPATDCAIVVRKGVSIIGTGRGTCGFVCSNNGLIIVACPAPNAQTLEGFDILGSWQSGNSGAGHGIFTLSDGSDNSLKDFRIKNIYVEKVASYGIAFQNGSPEGCEVSDCETYYTGADGFDLKARNDNATQPVANSAKNLLARRFNMRVDGSSGIDFRGVWHASGITVRDFGEDAAKNYTGIRFRTKPPVTDPYNKAAAKSTLFGFEIKSDAVGSVIGLSSGSDDVKICGGTIESVTNGVEFQGNVNGSANRNVISAVTVIGASNQGFLNTIGCASITYEACYAVGCTTGFRVEGVGTKLTSCEADGASPLSISSGAGPTTVVSPDCKFGDDSQITFYRVTSGRVAMEAKGASTNIDIAIFPKGTSGRIRYGTHVTNADAPITGYIEIRDAGGTTRKLAVIS